MWESIEHYCDLTIWKGKDAEGRRCYALTADRNGMPVEPNGCHVYYDLDVTREVARHREGKRLTGGT